MEHQYETKHANYSYFNKYMVNHIGFEKREMCLEQKCIGLIMKLTFIFSSSETTHIKSHFLASKDFVQNKYT